MIVRMAAIRRNNFARWIARGIDRCESGGCAKISSRGERRSKIWRSSRGTGAISRCGWPRSTPEWRGARIRGLPSYAQIVSPSQANPNLCSSSPTENFGECPPTGQQGASLNIQGTTYSASIAADIPADTAVRLDIITDNFIGAAGGSAFSSVDPFIEVDPTFADASQYIVAFRMAALPFPSPAL